MHIITANAGMVKPAHVPAHATDSVILCNNTPQNLLVSVVAEPTLQIDNLTFTFGPLDKAHPEAVFEGLRVDGDKEKLKDKLWERGISTTRNVRDKLFPLAIHPRLPPGHPDGPFGPMPKMKGKPKKGTIRAFLDLSLLKNTPFGRMDITPTRFTAEQLADIYNRCGDVLLLHMADLLGHEVMPFERIIGSANITRIDLAVDILGICPGDYVWWDQTEKGKKKPETAAFCKCGQLQTLYLGPYDTKQKKAACKFCIYYKTAEAGLDYHITRVEWRYVRLKKDGDKLLGLENPFKHLHCYDPTLIVQRIGLPKERWKREIGSLRRGGIQAALDELEHPYRERLKQALPDCIPPWWRPDHIWKQLPYALHRAMPNLYSHPETGEFIH